MTDIELLLCSYAVLSSSGSQWCFKSAANNRAFRRGLALFTALLLQFCSVVLVVLALRTLALSRLVSFAAVAYILVPIGCHFLFRERLKVRFWLGTMLIVLGIACTNY